MAHQFYTTQGGNNGSFFGAVKTVLAKYVSGDGRASRSEFWYFVLFRTLVIAAIYLTDEPIRTLVPRYDGFTVVIVFFVATLIPHISVAVRRLHDLNWSGLWWLVALIPGGGLILLVIFCMKGSHGSNSFGEEPLYYV
jgi:uncharacterized membrane protein YhaH (DUF805 family)